MQEKVTTLTKYLYHHKFVRYLFVGGTTLAIQIALGIIIHGLLKAPRNVAVFAAYWVSVIYNFNLNRWWTFSAAEKNSLRRHMVGYAALLLFNYLFTQVFVNYVLKGVNIGIALAIASIIQTVWNYFIYKNYIFTRKHLSEEESNDKT